MLKTTKIEEVKESDYMVVLDPPEAPLDPSKPKKRINGGPSRCTESWPWYFNWFFKRIRRK